MNNPDSLTVKLLDGTWRHFRLGESVKVADRPAWGACPVTKIEGLGTPAQPYRITVEWGTVPVCLPPDKYITKDMDKPMNTKVKSYEDIVASWDDDAADVLDAIEEGYLDKHIRSIAAACIKRHRVIDQEAEMVTVVKKPPTLNTKPIKAAATANAKQLSPRSVPLVNSTWAGENKTEARSTTDDKGRVRHFKKSDFMGKIIKIVPGTLDDPQYDGLRVKISGMGGKMMKVDWVDAPPPGSGYAKKVANDQPSFMTYRAVLPYLDIN